MKKLILLVFLTLFASRSSAAEFSGKVVNVSDGDTITVLTPDYRQIKVRLYGIDCPEKNQGFGQKARQFTADKVAGKNVTVEALDKDRYGRIVGLVGSLNQELVRLGLAWVYDKYCKASFCSQWKRDESRARQERGCGRRCRSTVGLAEETAALRLSSNEITNSNVDWARLVRTVQRCLSRNSSDVSTARSYPPLASRGSILDNALGLMCMAFNSAILHHSKSSTVPPKSAQKPALIIWHLAADNSV